MAPNWLGPYEIAECIGVNTNRLKNKGGTGYLKTSYSNTRLKVFKEGGNLGAILLMCKDF